MLFPHQIPLLCRFISSVFVLVESNTAHQRELFLSSERSFHVHESVWPKSMNVCVSEYVNSILYLYMCSNSYEENSIIFAEESFFAVVDVVLVVFHIPFPHYSIVLVFIMNGLYNGRNVYLASGCALFERVFLAIYGAYSSISITVAFHTNSCCETIQTL